MLAPAHWPLGFPRGLFFLPKEKVMKRTLIAAAAGIAIFASGQAFAQTVGVGPADTVIIAPEQRTVVKEYVVKEKVNPVMLNERVIVGATLPADVELRTVPTTWGPKASSYRYVYSNDNVLLVEPSSRKVIQIID
jgi:hypothetical protein